MKEGTKQKTSHLPAMLTKHKRSSYLGSNQGRQKSLSESGVITATLYKLVLAAQLLGENHTIDAEKVIGKLAETL
jgi:hypothetical protein